MRTSRMPTFALGAILAAALPAAAQTGSVRVNPPPPTPLTPGHVTSVTFGATPPASATFHGVCSPAVRVTFQGVVTTDVAQPGTKTVADQFKIIWSDWKIMDPDGRTESPDHKQTTLTATRYFDKSFNGWAKLQAKPWADMRPRESPEVALKVSCEPPVSKQLQHAPEGAPPLPATGH